MEASRRRKRLLIVAGAAGTVVLAIAVWAALHQIGGNLRLCSDNRCVVDMLGKKGEGALRAGSPHLDLWRRIWGAKTQDCGGPMDFGTPHL